MWCPKRENSLQSCSRRVEAISAGCLQIASTTWRVALNPIDFLWPSFIMQTKAVRLTGLGPLQSPADGHYSQPVNGRIMARFWLPLQLCKLVQRPKIRQTFAVADNPSIHSGVISSFQCFKCFQITGKNWSKMLLRNWFKFLNHL